MLKITPSFYSVLAQAKLLLSPGELSLVEVGSKHAVDFSGTQILPSIDIFL